MTSTEQAAKAQGWPLLAAIRWMTLALFAFTMVAVAARGAAKTMSTSEIIFFRCWFGLAVLVGGIMVSGRGFAQFRTEQIALHTVRSIVHLTASFCWVAALGLLTLAELTAIEFTAPLWTALIAVGLLGERLTRTRLAAAILGFIGVLVVVRPTGLTIGAGTGYAFLAALGYGCHFAMAKKLTRRDRPLTLVFYMTVIQAAASALLLLTGLRLPGWEAAGWVALMTLLTLGAHFSLSRAFSLADALVVAPLDFLRLPLLAGVGALLYSEGLDPLVLAGAAVVVLANGLNIWGERGSRLAPSAPRRGA
jgi:drug/metabolite transporter (DMT)-like permease